MSALAFVEMKIPVANSQTNHNPITDFAYLVEEIFLRHGHGRMIEAGFGIDTTEEKRFFEKHSVTVATKKHLKGKEIHKLAREITNRTIERFGLEPDAFTLDIISPQGSQEWELYGQKCKWYSNIHSPLFARRL